MLKLLRAEAQVPAVWLTAALFLLFGGGWLAAAAKQHRPYAAGVRLVVRSDHVGRVRRGAARRASG